MKKCFSFVLVFYILFFAVSITANSEGTFDYSLSTDSELKTGKSFCVSLNFSSDVSIGAVFCCVSYDDARLKLSSVSLEDRNDDEFLKYYDDKDSVKIIYMTKIGIVKRNIILKFIPKNKEYTDFEFCAETIHARSKENEPLTVGKSSLIEIHLDGNNSVEKTSDESSKYISESRSEVQESLRDLPKRAEESLEKGTSSVSKSKAGKSSEQSSNIEYSVITSDNSLENSEKYYPVIGVIVLIVLGVVISLGKYMKYRRKKKLQGKT